MSVIDRLKKHILVDGFHVAVDPESSHGSWIVDVETGYKYLDCYSQFASQALGWNHPTYLAKTGRLKKICKHKICNPDMYSEVYADFVDTFARITPDFCHYFFIEGGALAVENALKAAFDWKCQREPKHQLTDGHDLDVIHLREAFHGRSGYTLSLTNTDVVKTKWFPKFCWSRLPNPKLRFPEDGSVVFDEIDTLCEMENILRSKKAAAVIFETIQGEGGDNHFRPEFFEAVRKLTSAHETMFILDEVQAGMGLTGKWWAYQHFNIVPDMIVFGKKTQVCGFCSTSRIESATENVFAKSSRINSTWGGNIVDMERAKIIIEVIQEEHLLDQAQVTGEYFLNKLREIEHSAVSNVRGRGLMLAFDMPDTQQRDNFINRLQKNMLALKCGEKSVRFRPALTFTGQEVNMAIKFIKEALS